jgi:hypothetical protein
VGHHVGHPPEALRPKHRPGLAPDLNNAADPAHAPMLPPRLPAP